ncbi:MAG: hypothetical protein RIF33_24310 [Cyclobacteriaceae bacterium]
MKTANHLLSLMFVILITSCESPAQLETQEAVQKFDSEQFGAHWYDGLGELTGYELTQARYGELHKGEAVMIFVTEPFSRSKQVKLDNHDNNNPDQTSVLKLNFTKKFLTGIYPYSMMLSTFTPVEGGQSTPPLKIAMSSQEWCGHTFTQLNQSGGGFDASTYSYFESEGDRQFTINEMLTEDELWTRIRLNPSELPTGKVDLIPGIFHQRLRHSDKSVETAEISLISTDSSMMASIAHQVYEINYPSTKRNLKIYFETAYPHGILGWEETSRSGYGANAQPLTTTAKRLGTIRTPYWQQHNNEHRVIREQLGLSVE